MVYLIFVTNQGIRFASQIVEADSPDLAIEHELLMPGSTAEAVEVQLGSRMKLRDSSVVSVTDVGTFKSVFWARRVESNDICVSVGNVCDVLTQE